MKIADLKQPYRRMAEYCKQNITAVDLADAFTWSRTNQDFWEAVDNGGHPLITEEVKKHFPPDFDFSGEDIKTKPVIQMLDAETQKTIYTQLAKEGKFDQLPYICEFSESVELEVWDDDDDFKKIRRITGKYKGYYMDINRIGWNFAKLPTPKIDFSDYKEGDVVEFTLNDKTFLGYIYRIDTTVIEISYVKNQQGEEIKKENIKSITKIK